MRLEEQIRRLCHEDALRVCFTLSVFACEEALLAHCSKVGSEYLVDLVSLEPDLLQVLALQLEVKHIRHELVINLNVATHPQR